MNRRRFVTMMAATALMPTAAAAQTYPSKPIRLIVPFAAGGPADLFARALASAMGTELGGQIVIENRAGAGGATGVDAVAKSPADGYTFGIGGAAALSIVPFMLNRMPFDWQKDLTLLTLVSRVPEVVTVSPKIGVNTLAELVTYAKANPGKLSFGSAGVGSITHLAGELLKTEAGINLVHVPYRGAAPAVNDLLGGHVQMVTADVPVLLSHIESGAIKALAVTSGARTSILPNVPTTAEAGLPKVLSDNWYGLVAPAGLPPEILAKVRNAALAALRTGELGKQFASQAAIPSPTSTEEFITFVNAERDKWGPLVKATNAKLE